MGEALRINEYVGTNNEIEYYEYVWVDDKFEWDESMTLKLVELEYLVSGGRWWKGKVT